MLTPQHQAVYASAHSAHWLATVTAYMTLTLDLLTTKPNQFVFVPRYSGDKRMKKIHQCVPEILRKRHHIHAHTDGRTCDIKQCPWRRLRSAEA